MKLKISRVIKGWGTNKAFLTSGNFNDNGYGRRFAIHQAAEHWLDAFKQFNLIPSCVEPMFKNFVGNHYLDGAFTHEHKDRAPTGFEHVRCNVMLKKPAFGGNPVLDGEEFEVEEGDLWLCLASLELHRSTPISGGERMIFSFGGLVPSQQVQEILAK